MKFYGLDSLREFLSGNGFKIIEDKVMPEYNEVNWQAYRKLPAARECETNGEKIALWIKPYSCSAIDYASCEADITGEAGGLWFDLKVYAAKLDEIMRRLPEIEDKLVAAWNALSDDAVK